MLKSSNKFKQNFEVIINPIYIYIYISLGIYMVIWRNIVCKKNYICFNKNNYDSIKL